MNWSNEDRQRLLSTLDSTERVITRFYRMLLWAIVAAVLVGVIFIVVRPPWSGSQGEWFYFSVAVLMVLGWVLGQFTMLNHRQRR